MDGHRRNGPCWCGSGRKFKKCHLNRENEGKPSLWDFQSRLRDVHKTRTCFHPEAGDSTCSGPIVRAHTIRRSADLKAIARNGHVYQASVDFALLNKTGGRIIPQLIGINEASTFLGFCHAHDSSTFAPLETQSIGPTDEQAFLLAYRPLVKELYLKMRQLDSNPIFRETDKGRPTSEQFWIQNLVKNMNTAIRSSIRDLEHHKATFDAHLVAADFGRIRHVTMHLDRCPDIMCSGLTQPAYSFEGTTIQDLSVNETILQQISFSLIATENGGAAVFAWLADSDAASSVLVDSLLALPETDIPAALVRFAFSELENTFLRPSWWETLDPDARAALEGRFMHNVNPLLGLDAACLRDDGLRAVDWRVTRIEQKR